MDGRSRRGQRVLMFPFTCLKFSEKEGEWAQGMRRNDRHNYHFNEWSLLLITMRSLERVTNRAATMNGNRNQTYPE